MATKPQQIKYSPARPHQFHWPQHMQYYYAPRTVHQFLRQHTGQSEMVPPPTFDPLQQPKKNMHSNILQQAFTNWFLATDCSKFLRCSSGNHHHERRHYNGLQYLQWQSPLEQPPSNTRHARGRHSKLLINRPKQNDLARGLQLPSPTLGWRV